MAHGPRTVSIHWRPVDRLLCQTSNLANWSNRVPIPSRPVDRQQRSSRKFGPWAKIRFGVIRQRSTRLPLGARTSRFSHTLVLAVVRVGRQKPTRLGHRVSKAISFFSHSWSLLARSNRLGTWTAGSGLCGKCQSVPEPARRANLAASGREQPIQTI